MNIKNLIDILLTYNQDLPITLLHGFETETQSVSEIKLVSNAKVLSDGKTSLFITIIDESTRKKPQQTKEPTETI